MKRAIPGTIIYGLVCAALFAPLWWTSAFFVGGHTAFLGCLWLFLAGYLAILNRWRKVGLLVLALPLLLCLMLAGGGVSLVLFFCAGAATLLFANALGAKTRSGSLAADAFLMAAFAVMAVMAAPRSPFQWALVIWLFFLVQSAHFLLVPAKGEEALVAKTGEDRFLAASRRALEILERP
ncbi:MAG: hypothetical protein AB1921_16360 [Thermodesulfobacteriota bacterium]